MGTKQETRKRADNLAEAVRLLVQLDAAGGYFIRGIEDEACVVRVAAESARRGERIKELEEEVSTLRILHRAGRIEELQEEVRNLRIERTIGGMR